MTLQERPKNCSRMAGNSSPATAVPRASGTAGNSSVSAGKTAGQSHKNCSQSRGNSLSAGALLELFPFPPLYSGNRSGTRHIWGAPMPTCLRCPDGPPGNEAGDIIHHLRQFHPDLWNDAKPEHWMDGRPVWVDLTLTPDDFKE